MIPRKSYHRLPSDLTDQEWRLIQGLLPPQAETGRPRADDRKTLNGILYVLRTGCRWEDLPPERYGSGKTCWKRFNGWKKERLWDALEKIFLLELNTRRKLNIVNTYLDTSVRQNKRGAKMKSATAGIRRKTA
jgi:transposase